MTTQTVTGSSRIYTLVADPIDHVKSPTVFNDYFAEAGVDMIMVPVHVLAKDLPSFVQACRGWRNLAGIGVTIPHKEALFALVDTATDRARACGTVNVVRRDPNGSLVGDSVDGLGFVAGLEAEGRKPCGRRVLIVGAGGAGRSVALAMAAAGAAQVDVYNRTRARAAELVRLLQQAHPEVPAHTVDDDPAGYDVVVNATPLGMHPKHPLPVDVDRMDPDTLVAEVVMSPPVTPLLRRAQDHGLPTHTGHHMLDGQVRAISAFLTRGAR